MKKETCFFHQYCDFFTISLVLHWIEILMSLSKTKMLMSWLYNLPRYIS